MKFAKLLVVLCLSIFLLPLMALVVFTAGGELSPSDKARTDIPSELIPLYQAAAETCPGLDWTVLAAIHKLETGFGTGRAISSKGAQGPMQFLPSTFSAYGVDGNGDGRTEINGVVDSVFSATNLLCANGAGDRSRLADAVWNYNHSTEYVDEVLMLAASYGVLSVPGGAAYASTNDLLTSPNVILSSYARYDIEHGIVDARVVSLLSWISQRHTITVGVLKTGHSKYTRSGRVSHHYYGRAADISIVDGVPVSKSNWAARSIVQDLATIDGVLRPDELGHPFGDLSFPGGFTDADHGDHLHIGFAE